MTSKVHVVLIADQVGSRRHADLVPSALEALDGVHAILPFERTAGDEIQALFVESRAVIDAVMRLWRTGEWSIGLGIGDVEQPLPMSTREARGRAYVAARAAIGMAATAPARIRIVSEHEPDGDVTHARDCETVLALAQPLLSGRTEASWQALDLNARGLSQLEIGEELGISQGAVSRRLARAHAPEIARASDLAARLLAKAQGESRG